MSLRTRSGQRPLLRRLAALGLMAAISLLPASGATAQTRGKSTRKSPAKPATKKPEPTETAQVPDLPPFRAETRVYQARAPRNDYQALTDQVFRLTTANLDDEEKWLNAFGKVYPGFQFGLVQSVPLRVYRTSRPARLTLGRAMGRSLELLAFGAFSPGDGKTPGTMMVVELNLDFGRADAVTVAIQTMEVEEGKTYFFAVPQLKFGPEEYAKFLRPELTAEPFEGQDTFLIFSMSVQLNPVTTATVRNVDEKGAMELQARAVRKVIPEVPASLTKAGLGGRVRVYIEVAPEGRVRQATILNSSYPEMNRAVLAAARQWEFPASEFAVDQRVIGSVLVFDFPMPSGNVQPK